MVDDPQGVAIVESPPGTGCNTNTVPRNDDSSSSQVELPFSLNFFGNAYDHLWVNNNGNVTFDRPLSTFTPFGLLATSEPIIAPFFADIDTRGDGSDPVSYGYGTTTYDGREAFCVNWLNVGYYAGHTDKTNSVQLLLVPRPESGEGAFEIVFNYGRVTWETGDASDGVDGFGGTSARAGFSAGTGEPQTSVELPGSGIPGSFLDSSETGLVHGSLGTLGSRVPGRYVFYVDTSGNIADTYVALGDSFQSGEGAGDYDPATDSDTNRCHRSDNAYPMVLFRNQAVRLNLDFRACSGAVMSDMLHDLGDGRPPYDDGIAQIDDISRARLVTLGIGGNDLDFAGTVTYCAIGGIVVWIPLYGGARESCWSHEHEDADARIASLESGQMHEDLLGLYRLIRAKAPWARILVMTYPQFFPEGGGDALLGECGGIVRQFDRSWMNDQIKRANDGISEVVREAGLEVVRLDDVFGEHHLCQDDPAMNAVASNNPESYHPNQRGHQMIADRLVGVLGDEVEPAIMLGLHQTVEKKFEVLGETFYVNVGWPGSDVETTLISPSGVRYTRADPRGAGHGNGETYEYWEVDDPEPGEWTVSSYGANVRASGEPVTISTYDKQTPNRRPTATFTTHGGGLRYTFDASASIDPDGSIENYEWDFGDGTSATGARVQHTYANPGEYLVALQTTDDDGGSGFGTADKVTEATIAPAIVSGSSTSATNYLTTEGAGAGVSVVGDYECNSSVHIAGDLVITGKVHLTNQCTVDGDVQAGGEVTLDSHPVIGGSLTAAGGVRMQSTATVRGDITTAGAFTVTDGRSVAQLQASGALGGSVAQGTTVEGIDPLVPRVSFDSTEWAATPTRSWQSWINAAAVANNAPPWSRGRSASPGCAINSSGDSVNATSIAVPHDTVVDARRVTSGCRTVSIQGMTLSLAGDLTLVVNGLNVVNGLRLVSSDGERHSVRLIVPDGNASFSGNTTSEDKITTQVAASGTIRVDGPAQLNGQLIAGNVSASGRVTLHYRALTTPGVTID